MGILNFLSIFAYMLHRKTINSKVYKEAMKHVNRIKEIRAYKKERNANQIFAWEYTVSNEYATTKEEMLLCYHAILSAIEWGEKVR